MGLQVEIYRSDTFGDCTNGGISSRVGVRGFTLTNVEGADKTGLE